MTIAKLMGARLLENIADRRKGRKESAIVFCPVGDIQQLDGFVKHVREMEIDKMADFLFIYRKGLSYGAWELPAIHATEKLPLGTSGCFFEGQLLAYRMGYEYVVIADLDAFLDSAKTFEGMLGMAKKTGKVISPISTSQENLEKYVAYNLNQWSVFPRQAFETVGFTLPYFWRGGDDYEMICRYRQRNMSVVYTDGNIFHPMAGHTIFHKMNDKKKQYPYINGILKSLLVISTYDKKSIWKFFMWWMYYSFMADAFDDSELRRAIQKSNKFELLQVSDDGGRFFRIEKVRSAGSYSNISPKRILLLPVTFLELSLKGCTDIYVDRIYIRISRPELVLRMAKAALFIPFRLFEAVISLAEWKKSMEKIPFPITAENADEGEEKFMKLVETKVL